MLGLRLYEMFQRRSILLCSGGYRYFRLGTEEVEAKIQYSLSVVGKVCLQRRCVATKVTRVLLSYKLPPEYVYRIVA
jgi:hypothetical protein